MSEYFTREVIDEILIEKVNLEKATLKEAVVFKERLLNDFEAGYNKIIVDFSKCFYIDSSIVGALVVLVKSLKTRDGVLKVVIPKIDAFRFITDTGLDRIFGIFYTLNEAIYSFSNT